MGPRAGLVAVEKRRILHCWESNPRPVAIPTELSPLLKAEGKAENLLEKVAAHRTFQIRRNLYDDQKNS
jgi:hypothetical protein